MFADHAPTDLGLHWGVGPHPPCVIDSSNNVLFLPSVVTTSGEGYNKGAHRIRPDKNGG
jgi:hypothetical protein